MSSSSPAPESWISSFCSLLGHEYFAEVSEEFIEDDFNLTGLQAQVPMYKEALEMILDVEPEEDEDEEDDEDEEEDEDELEERLGGYRRAGGGGGGDGGSSGRRHMRVGSDLSVIESSAEMLYGLIHQRYITSRAGVQQMAEKYELQHFGVCPRVFCNGCRVLPVGATDTPGQDTVKLFCPSCLDLYTPPNSRFQTVDGAFFGTTFGCLFFMTFPDLDVAARTDGLADSASSPHTTTTNQDKDSRSSSSVSSGGLLPISSTTNNNAAAANSAANSLVRPPPPRPASSQQPLIINGIHASNLAPGLGPGRIYEPRIYGFRVSERARSGPRMQWLRSKPADLNELDEAMRWHRITSMDVDEDDEDDVEDSGDEEMELGGGGGGGGGSSMTRRGMVVQQQQQQQQQQQAKRKKASVRRRRQGVDRGGGGGGGGGGIGGGGGTAGAAGAGGGGGGGSPMDTNGVGADMLDI